MFRNVFLFAVFSVIVSASTSAFCETPWYMSVGGGAYFRPNITQTESLYAGPVTALGMNSSTFNTGPYFNLSAGYKLPNGLRLEGEFGFATYTIKTIAPYSAAIPIYNGSVLSGQSGGERKRYFEMAGLYYDLPIGGRFIPYLGAGFGAAEDAGLTAIFPLPGNGLFHAMGVATGTHPVTFGEAGVSMKLTDRFSVAPSYRFQYIFQSGNAHYENASIAKVALRYGF